ncbi:hypothetical protein [Klenkia marina]|uniref:hypothetical protein n=1 Tax=Klenkia marina TaxID=1960309 RepID=UPI000B853202|nr:hypothetical protein [Klenkia marina]
MKILFGLLCALALLVGGGVALAMVVGFDVGSDSSTSRRCTIGPPAGDVNYEECLGGEEGSGNIVVAVLAGSVLITGGLLAVASAVTGRSTAPVPPAARPWPAAPGPPGHER